MATPAALAAPDKVESLPPEWRMESDDDYSYDADYAPPPPVKGLVVHGYVADDSIVGEDGTVSVTSPETCPAPVTFIPARGIPQGYPERTTGEYWFYRSGDQALYLSRRWVYEVDSTCQGVAQEVSRIVRIVWFNGSATFIEEKGGDVTDLSTEKIVEDETYPVPSWLVKIDDAELLGNQQSRLVRKSPSRMTRARDEATGVLQTCFELSEAFILWNECYYSGNGPWRGYLLAAGSQDDAGGNYSETGTVKFLPSARIDGRLFEWDREIERSAAAP
ncbi:MAG: hypothetical protein NBV68_05745 [Erythrobacter sp.]|uniref:hypothetical protein n=1 Tax=Erythrobacter sp. TaxID=1042 RepID=UPI0025E8E7B8|nr:hypothetical protein [Erythrobacter sp.]MCL9998863.1 hypothetical protein [Erythrobacter sp.]